MILLYPIFLLLALPLGVALWAWGFRSRWLMGLRLFTLLLIVLALAGVTIHLPSQAGTIVVIADRSHSLPADAEAAQKHMILLLEESMSADDRLAVVSFGRNVAVEHAPQRSKFTGFSHEIGRDASNLTEAIEMGLSLIPRGAPGRIVMASDGQWTGRDPGAVTVRAAERGVALDYRVLHRNTGPDVAIVRIDAPPSVNPGESFLITAWVYASGPDEIAYDLRRGGEPLAAGKRTLESGLNRIAFRDQAVESGTNVYSLGITPKGADAIPENNKARFLVGVGGPRPLLVVTSSANSGFPNLLKAGGLQVKAALPEACAWTLEELSKYSGVILENVPADKIGHNGMETLAAWVQQTGAGLMLTGGRAAYGPGGYFKSPLDPIMPVSMELRQEHRKLSLAMVVALDRSGSMAMAAGGGRVKMDLANLGAAQVVDLLSPSDEFGCIAVDSAPHIIHDLSLLTDKAALRNRILKINSEGGGIYVYEALEASYSMLQKAKSGTRHIILFADAADAEEPKQYERLLAQCRSESITVSVIGLGKETDKDGQLLKDIAAKGLGRCFFTDQPEELPRLFAQDTFVVARSAFLDEPTPIQATAGLATITSKQYQPPQLGGYNLCYLRPQANLAAVSLDEYKAPVIASWQAGAGRVLCYTGEVDGKYTGAMAGWKDVGDFLTSLARWTTSRDGALPGGAVVTQERQKGVTTVKLLLDPDRPSDLLSHLPEVAILRATGSQKPKVEKVRMNWTGADSLALDVPLHGTETALATIDVPGHGLVALPPVCLPYSPEYEPLPTRAITGKDADTQTPARWGPSALEELARLTGGRERLELGNLWKEMPRHARLIPLAPWLLIAACATLLLEALQRLTGILSQRRMRWQRATVAAASAAQEAPLTAVLSAVKAKPPRGMTPMPMPETATEPSAPPTAAPKPTPPAAPSEGLLEALRQVQQKKRPRQ